MTRTPQSLASLSKNTAVHRVAYICPMKRIAGRLRSSKLVVVENVTLSFEWVAVSGSHRIRWNPLLHTMRAAWSGRKVKVAIAAGRNMHDAKRKKRHMNTAWTRAEYDSS